MVWYHLSLLRLVHSSYKKTYYFDTVHVLSYLSYLLPANVLTETETTQEMVSIKTVDSVPEWYILNAITIAN